ncbi:MAG: hypothetical protein PHN75_18665, partial [Syntrophales bacterium]|nr:hypothetical protein [Syntrophales bacterium]
MATNVTEFSKAVQILVIGCPRMLVEAAVVRSIIQFCEDTHAMEKSFEHAVAAADIVSADNNSVNVDISTYLTNVRPIVLTEFKIDGAPSKGVYIEQLNVMTDISEIAVQGAKLFTYPDRTHIKFYDIEARAQRFYIKQAYAPTASITTVDDLFFDRYHKAIEAGALAELLDMPKKDWYDKERAVHYQGQYKDGVAGAKVR